jgi:hypothetical protein
VMVEGEKGRSVGGVGGVGDVGGGGSEGWWWREWRKVWLCVKQTDLPEISFTHHHSA